MKDNDPWIEATLAAFPADDPLNPKRRDLLADAAVSVPPLGPNEAPPGDPPARFLARATTSRRRALLTNVLLFLTALGILWFQVLSPQARRDTRRILVAANPMPDQWSSNFAVPDFLLPKDPHTVFARQGLHHRRSRWLPRGPDPPSGSSRRTPIPTTTPHSSHDDSRIGRHPMISPTS